jgi:hypothetical protein
MLYLVINYLKSTLPYYFLSKNKKRPGKTPFKCGLSEKAYRNSNIF